MQQLHDPAVRFRTTLLEKEFWILPLLACLYCFRCLFLGETFFYRDLFEHYIPQRRLFVDLIRSGQFPLWDPYLHGGQPFLANINNVVLYPTSLLYLFLPLFTAFNLEILLHLILAAGSAYCLGRALKFHPQAALATALIFTFCGFTLSLINPCHFFGMAYVPLMLLCWHRYLEDRKSRSFVWLVILGACQLLTASAESFSFTMVTLIGWGLVFAHGQHSYSKIFLRWLALAFFISGFAAIQLIPMLEMVRHSSRSNIDYANFTTWSLNPKRLPELIFAGFLGRTDALAAADYWGSAIEGVSFTFILSIYFGLTAIVFAAASILRRKVEDVMDLKFRLFLFSLIVVFGLAALGRYLPLFEVFYGILPVHWFRYPIKFLIPTILPVALLAGSTFHEHFPDQNRASKRFLRAIWSLSIFFLFFAGAFTISRSFAENFQRWFFQTSSENIREGLASSFIRTAAIFFATALLYQYRSLQPKRFQGWALLTILTFDLLIPGKLVNPTAPRELFETTPKVASVIQRKIGDRRLYREESPAMVALRASSNDVVWRELWYMDTLNYYQAAYYKIPLIFDQDYDRMAQKRVKGLQNVIESAPWSRRSPLLSAGAVSVILTNENLNIAGIQPLATIHNSSRLLFFVYQNEQAVPRVNFVTTWVFVNPQDVLKAMFSATYDPRKDVVLEGNPSPVFSRPCSASQITQTERKHQHSAYIVKNSCDGYLVFAEPSYPGWRVTVDGVDAPILRANYAFSAIFLHPGTHSIERAFQPRSVIYGACISAGFLALLLFVLFRSKSRRRVAL